jgi:23S rRNA (guanine745-N1)-methyltransferase
VTPPLACPVRQCHLPLARTVAAWRCARGHTFDIARSGYVNLLQPQDRRSRDPGDPRDALEARARLLDSGVGGSILASFVARATMLIAGQLPVAADLGCGFGDALGSLHAAREIVGVGIDLATPAVDRASRRYPAVTWVAANADRRLPLLDASTSLVMSLHARRNPAECHRVLAANGHVLVAVPAPNDLLELRAAVQGVALERDRTPTVIAEHPQFDVIERFTLREQHRLGRGQLRDLLRGTYRGERSSLSDTVATIDTLDVTLASDVVVLRRR